MQRLGRIQRLGRVIVRWIGSLSSLTEEWRQVWRASVLCDYCLRWAHVTGKAANVATAYCDVCYEMVCDLHWRMMEADLVPLCCGRCRWRDIRKEGAA